MTSPPTLRHLAEAATPGPWTSTGLKYGRIYIFGPDSAMVADRHEENDEPRAIVRMRGTGAGLPQEANAEFIAAANPTAVLALLDRLEQATTQRERMEAEFQTAMMTGKIEMAPSSLYAERDALRAERDTLSATLAETQAKVNRLGNEVAALRTRQ